MVIIPDKLKKQLNELVEGKLIAVYSERPKHISCTVNTVYYGTHSIQPVTDETKSVIKTTRQMTVYDIFDNRDYKAHEDQKRLELIFNLEKEIEQLNKLKNSIDNIKSFIHNESKENK